jgi:hypothetical protein
MWYQKDTESEPVLDFYSCELLEDVKILFTKKTSSIPNKRCLGSSGLSLSLE